MRVRERVHDAQDKFNELMLGVCVRERERERER